MQSNRWITDPLQKRRQTNGELRRFAKIQQMPYLVARSEETAAFEEAGVSAAEPNRRPTLQHCQEGPLIVVPFVGSRMVEGSDRPLVVVAFFASFPGNGSTDPQHFSDGHLKFMMLLTRSIIDIDSRNLHFHGTTTITVELGGQSEHRRWLSGYNRCDEYGPALFLSKNK